MNRWWYRCFLMSVREIRDTQVSPSRLSPVKTHGECDEPLGEEKTESLHLSWWLRPIKSTCWQCKWTPSRTLCSTGRRCIRMKKLDLLFLPTRERSDLLRLIHFRRLSLDATCSAKMNKLGQSSTIYSSLRKKIERKKDGWAKLSLLSFIRIAPSNVVRGFTEWSTRRTFSKIRSFSVRPCSCQWSMQMMVDLLLSMSPIGIEMKFVDIWPRGWKRRSDCVANQVNGLRQIFTDADYSVYLLDTFNHCVMVADGPGQGMDKRFLNLQNDSIDKRDKSQTEKTFQLVQ